MKYKKLAAALITASLLTTNLAPLSCLAKDNKKSKNKLIITIMKTVNKNELFPKNKKCFIMIR